MKNVVYYLKTTFVMDLNNVSITVAVDEYLRHCRFERGLDEKTISSYRSDLLQFIARMPHEAVLSWITREYLRTWVESLSAYKYTSAKRKIASVRTFLHYLEVEYEAFLNPFHRLQIKIKDPGRLPVVMTSTEVGAIFSRLQSRVAEVKMGTQRYVLRMRDRAVIELLFSTGIRIGELCGLRNDDVDLFERRVRVRGKGKRERVVDIGPIPALIALREWMELRPTSDAPGNWLFTNRLGNALASQSVRTLVHQLCRECTITKKVTPHTFRHTFASLMLEEDVDVAFIQHILGHSSIATTQIYLHVNPCRQREILQQRHPRGRMM